MQWQLNWISTSFIIALLAWPEASVAQDCAPTSLLRRAKPTSYECATDSKLDYVYPDGGQSIFYERSNAILIFQKNYENDAWKISSRGANFAKNSLVDALRKSGFNIFIWEDLKSDTLDVVIQDSLRFLGANETNRLFFYYYGHGLQIDERGFYFIPTDGAAPIEENSELTYVWYELMRASFDRVNVKHAFYAFEGCYAGAIFERLSSASITPRREPRILREPSSQEKQRQFFTVTDESTEVPANGEFAAAISNAMFDNTADTNNDGFIVGRELIASVRLNYELNDKKRPIGKEQSDESDGDFIFGPLGPPPPPPPPPVVPPSPIEEQKRTAFFNSKSFEDVREVILENEFEVNALERLGFDKGWINLGRVASKDVIDTKEFNKNFESNEYWTIENFSPPSHAIYGMWSEEVFGRLYVATLGLNVRDEPNIRAPVQHQIWKDAKFRIVKLEKKKVQNGIYEVWAKIVYSSTESPPF